MSSVPGPDKCEQSEQVHLYALGALPSDETAALEAHMSTCPECRHEWTALRPAIDALASWPTDVLRPSPTLWSRLASRIGVEADSETASSTGQARLAPEWQDVAPGISCKLIATDSDRHRVSMLVRLAAGAHYPSHTHAGIEELHLLDGELWVEDQKLLPGDYRRAETGTSDRHVWSETGCTCVLITSPRDILG